MTGHKWKKDRDGAESCEREGCTVRKTDEFWQPKKRVHWRLVAHGIPPCSGKEAGEVKREWHGCTNQGGHSFSEGVCEEDGCGMDLRTPSERAEQQRNDQPAPSPLEVVRDAVALLESSERASDRTYSARLSAALATLEESIREVATSFYREREAYFAGVFNVSDAGQFRADWEGAVKRWEESIRKDEREKCAELIEDKWVGCHRMDEACGRDGAIAIRNRK